MRVRTSINLHLNTWSHVPQLQCVFPLLEVEMGIPWRCPRP